MATRLAKKRDIQALLIKGQPAVDLGVRADRPSIDVDVWVQPTRHTELLSLLEENGWRRLPSAPPGVGWGHAVTLIHPKWVCSIDLHRTFPGFLADPDEVFETLWGRRVVVPMAGQPVTVPDVVAAAAITTLHAGRSGGNSAETALDLDCALARAKSFSHEERQALARLAAVTDSAIPLAPLLHAADLRAEGTANLNGLQEWKERVDLAGSSSWPWIRALRKASWIQRPGLLLRALIPSDRDVASARAHPGRTPVRVRALLTRLRRGFQGFREPPSRGARSNPNT